MVPMYEILGVPADGFRSRPFTTSWLLPPYILAAIRLTISMYIATSISYAYIYFAHHLVTFHLQDVGIKPITFRVGAEGIRQSFSYFTYISFWSQSFYFFFASMHTFVAARRGTSWLHGWPRYLQAAHTVLYTCVTTFPFLVSSVYWYVLRKTCAGSDRGCLGISLTGFYREDCANLLVVSSPSSVHKDLIPRHHLCQTSGGIGYAPEWQFTSLYLFV
jgi:hypothetical protein